MIGFDTRDSILNAQGVGKYKKATELLYDIELQLTACGDKREYLLNVIEAFCKVKNRKLGKVAKIMQADLLL